MPISMLIPRTPLLDSDVLCYYDGPLLFWLNCEQENLLALALPDEAGPWPFVVIELSPEERAAFDMENGGLYAAFAGAANKWLLRDYGASTFVLEPLEAIPPEWMPGNPSANGT